MTDLVSQLVGALERLSGQCERVRLPGQPMSDAEKSAIAALTAAKAGGWVAVPVEAARLAGVALSEHPGHSPLTDWEHAAMKACSLLAARPLPNPPKEQSAGGLGSLDDGA